jgi:hypothetical protein
MQQEIAPMADEPRRRPRCGCALALVIALGVFAALLLPALRAARTAARRSKRANDLEQIGLALHNFHDVYQRLPLAVYTDEEGRPLSSWRFRVLCFVEAIMQHYYVPTEPWDSPDHRGLTGEPFHVYCSRTESPSSPERLHTNVVAITGPGTAFDGDRECRLTDIDSDTVLAIEIAESGVHWAAPGDLSIDEVDASILEGLDGHGVLVLFADGEVWFVPADVPLEDLAKFFTIEGAKEHDREQVLGPKARPVDR